MTDPSRFHVDVAALERDAATFAGWSDELTSMADAVPMDITSDAFSLLPGAPDVHRRFTDAATSLRSYLNDGAAEFAGLAERLDSTRRIYTEAEGESVDDIARVSRELDSL